MKNLSTAVLLIVVAFLSSNTTEAHASQWLPSLEMSTTSIFVHAQENNDPLIIIDGKVASKKELDELDSESIASVSVLKSKQAIEKYGDKGKYGVIEVVFKKNQTTKL
ncbi:hypothetical protein [Flavobacterium sp. GCM10023249]|uniref:hypothetical protein n=1 Tax=unclassified Flavobacterium TaxID=196869 RepID=UPI003622F2B8